jgi:hypothetical protein
MRMAKLCAMGPEQANGGTLCIGILPKRTCRHRRAC